MEIANEKNASRRILRLSSVRHHKCTSVVSLHIADSVMFLSQMNDLANVLRSFVIEETFLMSERATMHIAMRFNNNHAPLN